MCICDRIWENRPFWHKTLFHFVKVKATLIQYLEIPST